MNKKAKKALINCFDVTTKVFVTVAVAVIVVVADVVFETECPMSALLPLAPTSCRLATPLGPSLHFLRRYRASK